MTSPQSKRHQQAKEKKAKKRRAAPKTPGWSPASLAVDVHGSAVVIRSMVKLGLIETSDIGDGRKRITPRGRATYLATWGTPAQRAMAEDLLRHELAQSAKAEDLAPAPRSPQSEATT
jgi:hypothetical protein